MFNNFTNRTFQTVALSTILIVTFVVYLNHFDNPFFFDDFHTITENESIQSLDNWTEFFTNADTFSSLPANRSYRPMITLMNALDYKFGGGLNPEFFHYHIFFWFLVLIILVFILIKKIYKLSESSNKGIIITALLSTAWFAVHTTNAETINYICARSDSFSTLCVVMSLLLYIHPFGKKWHLYLITAIIGVWTKQTGVMFLPILFIYILLFEEHSLLTNFKTDTKKKLITFSKKVAPTAIVLTSLFIFNQYYLTPEATVSTNYTITRFEYISTQFFVTLHYLGNFILPINLSADPDVAIIKPWYDFRILSGLIVILIMVTVMIKTSFQKKLRPISFGISWFFIASLPTTLNPLFQIANDHRTFFPFIGLFIAIPWALLIIFEKYKLIQNKRKISILIGLFLVVISAHAYGTIQRNKVWGSTESLWKDVTIKSPKNGRGLMNYGLSQMEKGNYDLALDYYNKAYQIQPNYYVLHVNMGILYGAQNNHQKAKEHFEYAINLNSSSPTPEYFYGRYLYERNKYVEAKKYLNQALKKSPNHAQSKSLLKNTSSKITLLKQEIEVDRKKAIHDADINKLLELSLKYYNLGEYQSVISVCRNILEIDSNNAYAYNNICSAHNQMKQWKLAFEACKKSLDIAPDYQLAKNNLKWASDNLN